MVQVSKGCLSEVINIHVSLQEVIKGPLKGIIPVIDNCMKIIFTCRQIIPYLDLYRRRESLLINRFSCG